jgi:hypothetical protein
VPQIRIERPAGEDALAEFVALHDRVYAERPARWPASPLHLPTLLGQTPITKERELQPFVARAGGEDTSVFALSGASRWASAS